MINILWNNVRSCLKNFILVIYHETQMEFKCSIIGLPNVGKSTLFNALTNAKAEVANFMFCTIKPNIGVVSIPDPRLKMLANIVKSKNILQTTMKFVDVAGLVKGASKGKGLGNQFLNSIRDTEFIVHVVRCFNEKSIIHITDQINPIEDINTINIELLLSDLHICERAIDLNVKRNKKKDITSQNELRVLEKCLAHLENSNALRTLDLKEKEKKLIQHLGFLTIKPTIYVANISEKSLDKNPYLNQVYIFANKEDSLVVPVCAKIEAKIAELNKKERDKFMEESNSEQLGLDHLIHKSYTLLNLRTFFTLNKKEVRAWTIKIGETALQAAGKVHTDFKKKFIRARIISYEDFVNYGGELGAKEAGKIRNEGKGYIIQDGDIIKFLI